jgi:hypothetical protein
MRAGALQPTLALALTLCAGAIACPAHAGAASRGPSASTGAATNVTSSSAVVFGTVNAHGQPTDYVFQYGPTRKYGSQTALTPAGMGGGSNRVSQVLTGLQPLSTYHYRILATSPAGTRAGGDRTFRTLPVPLSLAIVGAPNPVVFGSAFLVEVTLTGTGAAAHEVALQARPFPYVSAFATIGSPELTSAAGSFSFPFLGLMQNAQLRVITVGKPTVTSPVLVEGVAVHVQLHVRATAHPGFARLYGTVAPAEPGALVGFQLLRGGHSLNQGGTVVRAATAGVSRFSRVMRVRRGLYEALVRISDPAHVSASSRPVLVR